MILDALGNNPQRYGAIRSWGSAGYICLVVGGGFAIEYFGASIVLSLGMILFLGMLACAIPLCAERQQLADSSVSPAKIWSPAVFWFLLSALLLQMSAGPFYGFLVLYLKQAGFSESLAGIMVALGVIAEIGMFMLAPRLLRCDAADGHRYSADRNSLVGDGLWCPAFVDYRPQSVVACFYLWFGTCRIDSVRLSAF